MKIEQIYNNRFKINSVEVEVYKPKEKIYNLSDFKKFVISHKNIFNDKTILRSSENFFYYVIKEFNYFQGKKSRWLWVYDFNNKICLVFQNMPNKFYTWDYLNEIDNILNLVDFKKL